MGVSTDAILGWGYAFNEEDHTLSTIENGDYSVIDRLELEYGVQFFTHCYHDCPMLAVSVKEVYKRAWRGDPQIMAEIPTPYDDAKERIKSAVSEYIEAFREHNDDEFTESSLTLLKDAVLDDPAYFLVSDWG